MDDNVVVKIVGEASGVQPAVDEAKGSLGGLEGTIANIGGWVEQLIAKFTEAGASGAAAGTAMAGGMREARVATEAEGNALVAMVMKVHEGAEAVRTFQMRAKEFAELYVAMFGAEIIAHWAEQLGEAAEKTAKLAAETGMTTGQIQGLSAAATLSGTNIDQLTKGLAMLDNRAVTAAGHSSTTAQALKAVGISANDGTSSMQRLLTVADKFHGMADGPEKAALAMQLFGRSGREMIPFLNQGSEAIQQLIDKSKEYGVVNDKAQEQGERLAESVNLAKIAWEGLKNTLTEAFGPLLTQVVDGFSQLVQEMHASYESGGAVKVIFDAITEVCQALGEMISAVALGFSSFFGTTKAQGVDWGAVIKAVIEGVVVAFKTIVAMVVFVADAFVAAFHLMKGAAEEFLYGFTEVTGGIRVLGTGLGEFMQVVGKVCWDALHLEWGSIKADWSNGMEQVRQAVASKANEIVQETDRLKNAVKSDFADMMNTGKAYNDFWNQLIAPGTGPKQDAPKVHFGGGGGADPDITSPGKKKKEKKPKDDIVEKLKEELEAKKDAWAEEQIAQDTAQEYSLQSEADFWNKAKEMSGLSAKDKLKIESEYVKAEQAVQKEAEEQKLAAMKRGIEEDGANYKKKLADLAAYVAEVKRFYGDKSKQAEAAEKEAAAAAKKAAEESKKAWQEYFAAVRSLELLRIDDEENQAKFEVELGVKSKGQLLANQKDFENRRYQVALEGLQQRLALDKQDPNTSPEALQKDFDAIEQLWRQHENKINEIDRQATLQRTQIERNAIASVSQSWGSEIGKMLTLQETFAQGMRNMYMALVQTIGNAIGQMIQQWLEKQLTALVIGRSHSAAAAAAEQAQTTATTTAKLTALTTVTTATITSSKAVAAAVIPVQAAIAGASGVASYAAAPWPVDMGAPAFGAAMSQAALAFGSVAAFDVGAWDLSQDQLAMVHSGEMIIPANLAEGMRGLFQAVGGSGVPSAGSPAGAGDVHLHYSPNVSQGHPADLRQLLANGGNHMIEFLHRAVRDGKLKLQPA